MNKLITWYYRWTRRWATSRFERRLLANIQMTCAEKCVRIAPKGSGLKSKAVNWKMGSAETLATSFSSKVTLRVLCKGNWNMNMSKTDRGLMIPFYVQTSPWLVKPGVLHDWISPGNASPILLHGALPNKDESYRVAFKAKVLDFLDPCTPGTTWSKVCSLSIDINRG